MDTGSSKNQDKVFTGDKKADRSWLIDQENRFVARTIWLVPRWLQTYHLTLMTVLWSAGVIYAGYMAQINIRWLWLSSLFIFLQYATDLYDGKVGKARDTGLVKWGYYMDHFLDYVFMCSFVVSYFYLVPDYNLIYLFGLVAVFGGFMVNAFLSFSATNEFRIEFFGIGPTNARAGFIAINTYVILVSRLQVVSLLPYVFFLSLFALALVVYRTEKRIWKIDMAAKADRNP